MNASQIAQAVISDRNTETARRAALDHFIQGASWDASVHRLLPVVIAEIKKPHYEGAGPFSELFWPAAAEVLDWELNYLRAGREG
jgi:hypothetical protein